MDLSGDTNDLDEQDDLQNDEENDGFRQWNLDGSAGRHQDNDADLIQN